MTTSPPRPPSPPLGPPRGTYFSRRNARQPLPPSPALTRILTSSINIAEKEKRPLGVTPAAADSLPEKVIELRYGCGSACASNVDELAHAAAVAELTMPVTLANSVSSLPTPTFSPGLYRCRAAGR